MRDALANNVVLAFKALLDALRSDTNGDPRVVRARRALEEYRYRVVEPAYCWHCGKPASAPSCDVGGCPLGKDAVVGKWKSPTEVDQ